MGGSFLRVEKKEICIQNVVVSASLKHGIDLDALAKAIPHVKYDPKVFPGLAFRLKRPKTCILIFSSGGMVCTGAKCENEARRAIMKVVKELKAADIIITGEPEVHVVNIVASGSLGGSVDLEALAGQPEGGIIVYEPEQFPAATYRMESPRVVFLIFATGKIVCVGAKKDKDIHEAVEKLRLRLGQMKVMV